MTAPRRLQLRRGNSTAVSSYTGAAGEVVIDTTNWTLRVHDGVTQGGYVVTANTTSLNANITQANLGLKGYVDLANTIQSQQISAANLGMKGYVDSVASQSIYGNSNVKSYFTEGFDGNIIPSANVTYSLGSLTRQWKDLFVSNNTIYVGGVPLTIDATGNLIVNGNTIPTVAYVNTVVANVTVDLSSYALNANVTAANVGLKGYVDQANTIQSAQISSANVGMKGYVDKQITDLIGGAPSILDTLNEIAASINDDANVYTSLTNSIATANTALKGYVDQANTIQSTAITEANLGLKGYVDSQSFYSNTKVSAYLSTFNGNIGNLWIDSTTYSPDLWLRTRQNNNVYISPDDINHLFLPTAVSGSQLALAGYGLSGAGVFSSNSYVQLDGNGWDSGIELRTSFNSSNYTWTFSQVGNLTFPTGASITNGYPGGTVGDGQGWFVTPSGNAGGVASADGQQYVQVNNGYGIEIGTGWPGNAHAWHFGLNGNLTLPAGGYLGNVWGEPSETTLAASPGGFVAIANSSGDQYVDANDNNVLIGTNYSSGGGNVWLFYQNGWLVFPDGAVINNGTFKAASNSSVNLLSNNEHTQVRVDNANVEIYTSPDGSTQYQWTFGTSGIYGALTLPGEGIIRSLDDSINLTSLNTTSGYANIVYLGSGGGLGFTDQAIGGNWLEIFRYGVTPEIKAPTGNLLITTVIPGVSSNTWTFGTDGNITLPSNVSSINYANGISILSGLGSGGGSSSSYGNVNVKAYTESMGFKNYSNVNVAAYLNATGYNLYSNVNVAVYLTTATITTTGNITAQNLIGNISITGNVTGTSANVTLQAGSFSSTFDNQGNVRLPTAYVTGNVTANYFVGNGALLTGIAASSNYSNVQVATYLPTYSGNIANIRLGVSGVLTFADGTTQTTAGGGSYSNVQVAAYLTTGVNTAAPQIQLTNATSNFIKYNNVGVGAPTFTTANVGTRIIYWSSVDANTADYAVGIDAGVLWHGIPRATSGFAFKWYAGTTQIAMLEGTGSFTIANIRLSPSGNIVFADGTVQTTAATGTYSNIQVATYLPTYGGAIQSSNVQTTTANIQTTTAATNTATGALRVMGGAGVAGTVFAGQLNTTGNLIANAISAYSLNTVANVVASVVSAGTINSAGNVLAQNIIGTIATASQTGITAVGTLATLTVSGNVTSSNFVGSTPNVQLIANTSITTFDVYGNVTFPGNNVISSLGITMPTRPAFRAYGGATAQFQTTANVNLKGATLTVDYNQGNYANVTTGQFVAPIAGLYQTTLVARVANNNGLNQMAVLRNGNLSGANVVCFWETDTNTGVATHFGTSGVIRLAVGDYLSANVISGNINFDVNDSWTVTYIG